MLLTELRILIEELEQPDQRHYGSRRRETMYSRKGFPTSSGSLSPRGELYYDGQEQSVWCATRRCFMRSTGRRSYSIRTDGNIRRPWHTFWREARMAPQTRAKLVAEIAKLRRQQSDDLAEGMFCGWTVEQE